MRYLCLVYGEEELLDSLPGGRLVAMIEEHSEHIGSLLERGLCIAAGSLEPAHTATTVRLRSERVRVTDGPAASTREPLGGFCLIEARDLNDAIRVASAMPAARLGAIEVRPVRSL